MSFSKPDLLHLDSGCSRNITGNISLLTSVVKCNEGKLTFGDGVKTKIYSKSIIDYISMTNFGMSYMLQV